MLRFILLILPLLNPLFWLPPAHALVEIGTPGNEAVRIDEIYQREGTSFLAIDDVLMAIGVSGEWDSVEHVYRIRTSSGRAIISPGSQFLKVGENITPIVHRPRFIDGKLRVSEDFIQRQLAPLLSAPLYYVNHDPAQVEPSNDPLDRLFSFLLRKKTPAGDHSKRIVAIDPGHGGRDPGALGLDGIKEKELTLAVAERLEKLLKMHQDAPVLLTRNDDYAVEPQQRLEIVADGVADVMISVHAQSYFTSSPSGILIYIQPQLEQELLAGMFAESSSMRLAASLQQALTEAGFVVRAIQQQSVLPLGRGDLPRVLVELGNLVNPDELAELKDATRQQDLARAFFDGVQSYFQQQQEIANEHVQPAAQ
ncbi:MAG: hypothetical protein C0614_03715 [Desulfuromonas sp.]|nr:MAG: hypothetical protein C0614_03715 [Desulfuromonas sp.]